MLKFDGYCLVGLVGLMAAGASSAETWVEAGDADEFPAYAAQEVSGDGPLHLITGSTSTTGDDFVDSYVIEITDPDNFTATTSEAWSVDGGAVWDTRLFLFDLEGNAILANDDAPTMGSPQSYLSAPGAYPGDVSASAIPLPPGTYVLVVTGWQNDPIDESGAPLFALDTDYDALFGPDPSAGEFDVWEDYHGLVMSGDYSIALDGASCVGTTPPCHGDVNDDSNVNVVDLIAVLFSLGNSGGPADINEDGWVNLMDVLELLLSWGSCP